LGAQHEWVCPSLHLRQVTLSNLSSSHSAYSKVCSGSNSCLCSDEFLGLGSRGRAARGRGPRGPDCLKVGTLSWRPPSPQVHIRPGSARDGEGSEPSGASKAGRGTHPTSGGGVSAPVSEPGR